VTKASNTQLKTRSLQLKNLYTKLNFLADTWLIRILIKNCLFIPKFNFLLKTSFWKFSKYVHSIDSSVKSSLKRILNLRLTDLLVQWCQSTLTIRFDGLGIRRISDICLPAFLSTTHCVKKLVSLLLNSNELIILHYDEASAMWDVENDNETPTISQFQKNWDNINIKRMIANDLIFNSPRDLTRYKCRKSGSWLHAIPSPNIGTLLRALYT
jgi:hypothetical protein